MEADHFAGQATDRVIGVAELERDLADYDPGMGMANRDLVLQHHSARDHVIAFLAAVAAPAAAERPPAPLRELARLIAMQWSWERLARGAQHAHAASETRLAEAVTEARARDGELAVLRAELSALRAELDAIKVSRAWRLAARYWDWRGRFTRGARTDGP